MRILAKIGLIIFFVSFLAKAEADSPYGYYSIESLNAKEAWGTYLKQDETYLTSGYVVFVYQCPPCPPGAECKPCMQGNAIISQNNKVIEDYNAVAETELVIYTEKAKELNLGEKYNFMITFRDKPVSPVRPYADAWWQDGQNPPWASPTILGVVE